MGPQLRMGAASSAIASTPRPETAGRTAGLVPWSGQSWPSIGGLDSLTKTFLGHTGSQEWRLCRDSDFLPRDLPTADFFRLQVRSVKSLGHATGLHRVINSQCFLSTTIESPAMRKVFVQKSHPSALLRVPINYPTSHILSAGPLKLRLHCCEIS